jgi:hypothetical protein
VVVKLNLWAALQEALKFEIPVSGKLKKTLLELAFSNSEFEFEPNFSSKRKKFRDFRAKFLRLSGGFFFFFFCVCVLVLDSRSRRGSSTDSRRQGLSPRLKSRFHTNVTEIWWIIDESLK